MTQLNIRTQNLGWGPLGDSISEIKMRSSLFKKAEQKLWEDKQSLSRLIDSLNEKRKARVIELLKEEKRGICILHRLVFKDCEIGEWLVPEEELLFVTVTNSWSVTHSCYDGDKTYSNSSSSHSSIACNHCRSILSRGCIVDDKHVSHRVTEQHSRLEEESFVKFYSFYSDQILDKISAEYFQMPVVEFETLALLQL